MQKALGLLIVPESGLVFAHSLVVTKERHCSFAQILFIFVAWSISQPYSKDFKLPIRANVWYVMFVLSDVLCAFQAAHQPSRAARLMGLDHLLQKFTPAASCLLVSR